MTPSASAAAVPPLLGKVRRVGEDVRSLGRSAPLRAAYEGSKRLGGHHVLFGLLAGRPAPRIQLRPALRLPRDVPVAALVRNIRVAEEVLAGNVTLFGQPHSLGSPPDGHAVIDGDGTWPLDPWWKIDIRSDARAADVKWAWELGRARHLAVLARAASSGDQRFRTEADRSLHSWTTQNPPELGIHWYSNLEIALRSIVYEEISTRIAETLSPETGQLLTGHMWHSGRHLLADLPYTVSTMRNNHLLGDALGLQVVGSAVSGTTGARRWRALGERLFDNQAGRHFRPDGSMVEDSLSYHRFVLEMLIIHAMLDGHIEPHPAMVRSAQMLARLGALEGPVPQYGDWDEGRVLVSTQDPSTVAGSVRAALSMAGSGAPAAWREEHDECAWYVGSGEPVDPEPAERHGHDVGGGIARAQRGVFTSWLKAGSGPSHGHADLCSTPVLVDGHWVVGDPGTGTYNGPLEERNYFRSSVAHNVLRIEGLDQLEPYRAFRWKYKATGRVGVPIRFGDVVIMWGGHDAFARLSPSQRIIRTVVVAPTYVAVADWAEGPSGGAYELSIPLGPGVRWDEALHTLELPSGRFVSLSLPEAPTAVAGQTSPFDGWWSRTYGQREPCTRLQVEGRLEGPVSWSLSTEEGFLPHSVSASELVVGDLSLGLTWDRDHTWLAVRQSGRSTEALLRWTL